MVKLVPENIGVAVGISLLSYIELIYQLFSSHFRFMAAILNFSQPLTLLNVNTGPIVKLDPENVYVAV